MFETRNLSPATHLGVGEKSSRDTAEMANMNSRNLAYLLFVVFCAAAFALVSNRQTALPDNTPSPEVEVSPEKQPGLTATVIGGPALEVTRIHLTLGPVRQGSIFLTGDEPTSEIIVRAGSQYCTLQKKNVESTKVVSLETLDLKNGVLEWEVDLGDYRFDESPGFANALADAARPSIAVQVILQKHGDQDPSYLKASCFGEPQQVAKKPNPQPTISTLQLQRLKNTPVVTNPEEAIREMATSQVNRRVGFGVGSAINRSAKRQKKKSRIRNPKTLRVRSKKDWSRVQSFFAK
jgi:hypothetical protein